MSLSRSGVQSHIKKKAPYATYQGYCLHTLNLVICKSTKIRNIINSCQQAFLFFFSQLSKTEKKINFFLEQVIGLLAPESKNKRIMVCAKQDGVERHHTFSTIL